jgi:hypothetical protein
MNTSGDNDSVRYRTPDHIIYVSCNEILETTTETVSGNAHTRNEEDSEEEKGGVESENHSAQQHIIHVTHNVTPEKKAKKARREAFIDNDEDIEEGKAESEEVAYYDSETESMEEHMTDTAKIDSEIISGQYESLLSGETLKSSLGIVHVESKPGQDAFAHHLYLNIIQKEEFSLETGFIGVAHLARGPNSYEKQFNATNAHSWKADYNPMPRRAHLFRMSKPTNIKLRKVFESTQKVRYGYEMENRLTESVFGVGSQYPFLFLFISFSTIISGIRNKRRQKKKTTLRSRKERRTKS